MVPLYNHVPVALPVTETELNPLYMEILSFLWTRTNNLDTIQKRRLVAAKRLPASFDKGGLQIQHPSETAEGLRLNLIPKCFEKIWAGNGTMFTMFRQKRRPDLTTHVNYLGPTKWITTGDKIMSKNRMVGMAFKSIADYLAKLEDSPEDWHLSPVRGPTRVHKLFPFYLADLATLETHRIVTVSQIFETHLKGRIDKTTSPELLASHAPDPSLQHKLQIFTCTFLQQPFHNKYSCPRTHLATLVNLNMNLSRWYKLKCRELLDTTVGVDPTYCTRIRDNIAVRPSQRMFTNAYHVQYYGYRLLCLRLVRQHSKSSIAQYGQTTRHINPECDQTLTVNIVERQKPWSISFANAKTTRNHFGATC
jgi:hypothetical protein